MAMIEYDTGSFPLSNGKPAYEDPPPRDRLTTRHWPLLWLGAGFGVAAGFAIVVYALEAKAVDQAVRAIIACCITIFTGSCAGSIVAAVAVRANGQQHKLVKCSVKRHVDKATADLRTGPDLEAMAKRYVDLTRTFADRLAAIETKLDSKKVADVPQLEGDDRYLAGFADGLAGRALGEGNVVPLNGANGHGRAG